MYISLYDLNMIYAQRECRDSELRLISLLVVQAPEDDSAKSSSGNTLPRATRYHPAKLLKKALPAPQFAPLAPLLDQEVGHGFVLCPVCAACGHRMRAATAHQSEGTRLRSDDRAHLSVNILKR